MSNFTRKIPRLVVSFTFIRSFPLTRCLSSTSSVTQPVFVESSSRQSFFLLRHGETDANAEGLIQGSADFSRLTQHGKEQAAHIAQQAFHDVHGRTIWFGSVYVSPLTRARETLSIFRSTSTEDDSSSPLLLPSDELILDNLREIDLHAWEGHSKEELEQLYPESYKAWKVGDPHGMVVPTHHDPCPSVDQGKTSSRRPLLELWERAGSVWEEVHDKERSSRRTTRRLHDSATTLSSCLMVSHGSLGQALLGTAMGWDATYFRTHEFPNCGLIEIEWDVCRISGQENGRASRWRWRWPDVSEWSYRRDTILT